MQSIAIIGFCIYLALRAKKYKPTKTESNTNGIYNNDVIINSWQDIKTKMIGGRKC
jgi:hypothetical protein